MDRNQKTEDFDLPIITRIVLKEVNFIIKNGNIKGRVPFYNEGSSSSNFTYLILFSLMLSDKFFLCRTNLNLEKGKLMVNL